MLTWRQRYHYRLFIRNSIWVAPITGLVLALASFRFLGEIGRYMNWFSEMDPDAARSVVSLLSSALLTFIVFIMSAILVAVQLASAQLTSRIIVRSLRENATRASLFVCVYCFTFSLALLSRIDSRAPRVELQVCIWSSLLCVGVFVYLVDYLAKSLRPIAILTGVAREGVQVLRNVYPHRLGDSQESPTLQLESDSAQLISHTGASSVLLALDCAGLAALAEGAGVLIEVVPQVGDFVVHGDPLFRIYGSAQVAVRPLLERTAFGAERTMEQDPAFALRILVDIASKALSPAINDPTTGVLALDQIHLFLRAVGLQRLDTGVVRDAHGEARLFFDTPNWDDFVRLGLTEIRHFGAGSIQIARRMRALLVHLLRIMPEMRWPPLQEQLELLNRSVERSFPDAEDRALAMSCDLQGLGGSAQIF